MIFFLQCSIHVCIDIGCNVFIYNNPRRIEQTCRFKCIFGDRILILFFRQNIFDNAKRTEDEVMVDQ